MSGRAFGSGLAPREPPPGQRLESSHVSDSRAQPAAGFFRFHLGQRRIDIIEGGAAREVFNKDAIESAVRRLFALNSSATTPVISAAATDVPDSKSYSSPGRRVST